LNRRHQKFESINERFPPQTIKNAPIDEVVDLFGLDWALTTESTQLCNDNKRDLLAPLIEDVIEIDSSDLDEERGNNVQLIDPFIISNSDNTNHHNRDSTSKNPKSTREWTHLYSFSLTPLSSTTQQTQIDNSKNFCSKQIIQHQIEDCNNNNNNNNNDTKIESRDDEITLLTQSTINASLKNADFKEENKSTNKIL
jgi:tRNA nucleotidyltransferase/poly(A) polymerase